MKSSLQIEALGLNMEVKLMISTLYKEPKQTFSSKVKNVLTLSTCSQQRFGNCAYYKMTKLFTLRCLS